MSLFNELPIVFPWYEKEEQQNRYNENVEVICDYKLITPANALLPFQFFKPLAGLPIVWEVFEINSKVKVADITADIPILRRATKRGLDYFTYTGQALDMNLEPGYYEARLVFDGGIIYWSEMFYVPVKKFNVADDDEIGYLRFSWYNMTDLSPIFYNDLLPDLSPRFKNVLYLDTFITASEPEIVEDGERDGNDDLIPTFQKVIISYRITDVVPDFIKKALVLLPMHDHVLLTTKNGVRKGELLSVKINSALEASGALSVVDIIFQETVAIMKKGCSTNMT